MQSVTNRQVILCSTIPIHSDRIDTLNRPLYITPDRMNAFQFTNAHDATRMVAVYAQQLNNTKLIDFGGVAAGVSLNVYLITIVFCCLLVLLFALIEYVIPSNSFVNYWNISSAVLPCFNSQVARKALRITDHPSREVLVNRSCFDCLSKNVDPPFAHRTYLCIGVLRAPNLEHSHSLARCVAIISTNIFVFMAIAYYQTVLLSIITIRHRPTSKHST